MTNDELLDFCYTNDVELKFDFFKGPMDSAENPYQLRLKMKRIYPNPTELPRRIFIPQALENVPFSDFVPTLEEMVTDINSFQRELQLSVLPESALALNDPICVVWEIPNDLIRKSAHSPSTNLEYLQQLNCEDFASILFDLIWCPRGQDTDKCGSCKMTECECCLDYGSLLRWLKEKRQEEE